MLKQIGQLLDGISGASVTLQATNGAGRHFELLVIAEIADELHKRGYQIQLISSDGIRQSTAVGPLVYRQRGGAPAPVPAASQGANGPTSIRFRSPVTGQEWEIWNGVEFEGRSGGHHEFDVAIVPQGLASAVRTTGGSPLGNGWVSIECKHVADAASPDEARALIARIYDTTILTGHCHHFRPKYLPARIYPPDPALPGYGTSATTFRERNVAGYAALVRTTGFSTGAAALADGYFIIRHGSIAIGSAALSAFRSEIADWIDANL